MKIATEHLPHCQIAVTIEPDAERVDEALKRAARKVAAKYTIPGYRKGKAPFAAVVRAYGKEALFEQVVEDMGDDVYRQALEQTGLNPIAPGELKDVTFDPLVFHLVLSMPPQVDLGDYRSLRLERPEVLVDEASVDQELLRLQELHAEWAPFEGGAQYDDLLNIMLTAAIDGKPFIEDEAFEIQLEEESRDFPPGFDAQFIGAKSEDVLSFDLIYPENWHTERAGATAHFDAVVQSVKRLEQPPLDDDLAPLAGDFDTLDDLKASIREGFRIEQQAKADEQYSDDVVTLVIENAARLDYPEVLLDDYTERVTSEQMALINRFGMPLKEYLRIVGRTEEQFRSEARETARRQLQGDLVLETVVELEHLQPTEDEVNERIAELLARDSQNVEGLHGMLNSESGRHVVMHDLERRNAYRRLAAIADGTAPSLEEVEAAAAARAASEAAAAETPAPEEDEPAVAVAEASALEEEEPTVAVEG